MRPSKNSKKKKTIAKICRWILGTPSKKDAIDHSSNVPDLDFLYI